VGGGVVKDSGILQDLEEGNEIDGESHRWTDGQMVNEMNYLRTRARGNGDSIEANDGN
jgi:hypothetical protein